MTAQVRGVGETAARRDQESGHEYVSRVACRIFRERGYHATSMRAISSSLGWQPAALYYYYDSKEDLLFRIMESAVDTLFTYVQDHIDPGAAAPQRLTQAITAHITLIAEHLDELSVFLHEMKALGPKRRELLIAKRNRYEHIFRDILHDGIKAGEFTTIDPRLACFMILAACNWLYNWYHPEGTYQPEEIARSFSEMFLHGLLPEASAAVDGT